MKDDEYKLVIMKDLYREIQSRLIKKLPKNSRPRVSMSGDVIVYWHQLSRAEAILHQRYTQISLSDSSIWLIIINNYDIPPMTISLSNPNYIDKIIEYLTNITLNKRYSKRQ
jgi:hypothetical protein